MSLRKTGLIGGYSASAAAGLRYASFAMTTVFCSGHTVLRGGLVYRSMTDAVALRLPRADEEQEFLSAHRATTPEVPNFLHYYEEGMPLARYLLVLADHARGKNLPAGHVPSTFLFAFDGSRIVGRVSIRHDLNAYLLRVGGHIGYVVVPEFRRRGFATAILRQSLQVAQGALGISRVLLTCDDDNVGSIRTIEKNGGVLENIVTDPDLAVPKRRYWIEAPASLA